MRMTTDMVKHTSEDKRTVKASRWSKGQKFDTDGINKTLQST